MLCYNSIGNKKNRSYAENTIEAFGSAKEGIP